MSNVVPRSDPLTTGEIVMVDSLFALVTTPSGFGIAKLSDNTFVNVSLTGGASPLAVVGGGTGNASFTAYGVIIGGTTATGALQQVVGLGLANQVLTSTGSGAAPVWQSLPAAGSGSVTTVSVTTANGVSGSVANAATTPAITITLGAITPTTVNGNTFTTGTYTLTGQAGKTLTFNGSITLTGTDAQTYTFPSTSATLARTDAANTFTGHQTIEGVTSTGATGTGKLVFDGTPTLVTPVLGVATATSINGFTITSSTGTLTVTNLKTLTVSDSTTLATNSITLGGGEVITFSATNALSLLTTGTSVITFPAATDTVVVLAATQTLSAKFITPQLQAVADAGGTYTPVSITNDFCTMTALSQATTIAAPSGSPVSGEKLIIRIKDNGTARALTWNVIYRASSGLALPTTTTLSKTLYCGFIYNSTDTKWDLVAYLDNF